MSEPWRIQELSNSARSWDKEFGNNLVSSDCHDFAFILACGLVKPEDRAVAWENMFGLNQLDVLTKARGLSNRLLIVYALLSQNSDAANHGVTGDSGAAGGFYINDISGGTANGGAHQISRIFT